MTSLTSPGFLVSAIATVPNVCRAQYSFNASGIPSLRAIFLKHVLDAAQFDVTRCGFLGRKYPALPLSQLFLLNVPEQSNHALAQRHRPPSFARLALGIEIESTFPVDVL